MLLAHLSWLDTKKVNQFDLENPVMQAGKFWNSLVMLSSSTYALGMLHRH
jgi:hypothetical protein